MAIAREHELHKRRLGRNMGVGLVLGAFVAIVFVLTMVKLTHLPAVQATADKAAAEAAASGTPETKP